MFTPARLHSMRGGGFRAAQLAPPLLPSPKGNNRTVAGHQWASQLGAGLIEWRECLRRVKGMERWAPEAGVWLSWVFSWFQATIRGISKLVKWTEGGRKDSASREAPAVTVCVGLMEKFDIGGKQKLLRLFSLSISFIFTGTTALLIFWNWFFFEKAFLNNTASQRI